MIRDYENSDRTTLYDMLTAEGLIWSEMGFHQYRTRVLEHEGKVVGMYTLRNLEDSKATRLTHFCFNREHRSPKLIWQLYFYFKKNVKTLLISFRLRAKNKQSERFSQILRNRTSVFFQYYNENNINYYIGIFK